MSLRFFCVFLFVIVLFSAFSLNAHAQDVLCGNGVMDGGEQCDDGNLEEGDGCNADCGLETSVCEIDFSKTFGEESASERAYSVKKTSDGGYIITASYSPQFSNQVHTLAIKTDSLGSEEWRRVFLAPPLAGSSFFMATAIDEASDGGYILAGGVVGGIPSYGDAVMMKITQTGEEEWRTTFGAPTLNEGFGSVKQASDGGYIAIGSRTIQGLSDNRVWIVKTNSEGNEEWSKTFYEFTDLNAHINSTGSRVEETPDAGFAVSGQLYNFSRRDYDMFLLKTDAQGNEEWSRIFGGAGNQGGSGLDTVFEEGVFDGYIIGGYTNSLGEGQNDAWVIKTDELGFEEWNKTIGGPLNDYAVSAMQGLDGDYIVTGITGADNSSQNGNGLLAKLRQNGDEVFYESIGGIQSDFLFSVDEKALGEYVTVGSTKSFASGGFEDIWLVKTQQCGVRPPEARRPNTGLYCVETQG